MALRVTSQSSRDYQGNAADALVGTTLCVGVIGGCWRSENQSFTYAFQECIIVE
jgi:hypothetical protein